MAQQQSQAGQLGIKTQASAGVYASPGVVAPNNGVFPRVQSGSMVPNRTLITPDPEVGGNRDIPGSALGPVVYEGSYEMYARFESLATLLNCALGSTTITDNTTWYRHTHTPLDGGGELPWLSLEEGIGQSFETFGYTDVRVNTLSFEADADGLLMVNTDMIGRTGISGIARTDINSLPASAYVDGAPLISGPEIAIEYNSLVLCAKSFSLSISNNFESDDYCLGQLEVEEITPKRREFTMSITLRPQDALLWKQANYGSPSVTGPIAGQAPTSDATITVTSSTTIDGSQPYALSVAIPAAIIQPFEVANSGEDTIETDFEVQVVRPDNAVSPITIEVDNSSSVTI